MKRLDQILRISVFAALSSGVFVAACAQVDGPSDGEAADVEQRELSGSDWYRGLFFGQGPVADVYANLPSSTERMDPLEREAKRVAIAKRLGQAQKKQVPGDVDKDELVLGRAVQAASSDGLSPEVFEETFFGYLEESRSNFLPDFKDTMESGDYARIQAALEDASDVFIATLADMNRDGVFIQPEGLASGGEVGAFVFLIYQLDILPPYTYQAVVLPNPPVLGGNPLWLEEESSLFRDQFVHEIVAFAEQRSGS